MAPAAGSVKRYEPFFRHRRTGSVLDYGAGKLRNSLFLARSGYRVYAADLPEQVARIRRRSDVAPLAGVLETGDLPRLPHRVDLVLSTYVFNIIPGSDERRRYLENAARVLRPGGYLLMEVTCKRSEPGCGECPSFARCGVCPRTFSVDELDATVTPHGFRRVCHYYRRQALAAVYQRTG